MTHPSQASGPIDSDLEWINDYVGVPHVTNGRDRNGFDCWGLMCAVWRDRRGIELPDFRAPNDATLLQAIEEVGANYGKWPSVAPVVQVEAPCDWDFVVCRRHALALHMGLYIGRGVLHSTSASRGTVWEPEARFFATYQNRDYWRWLG